MSKKKFLFLLLVVALAGFFWQNFSSKFVKSPQKVRSAPRRRKVPSKIACSVSGEVNTPGIYYLPSGALVGDLVTAAGGLTSRADSGKIQMDDFLEDRESIVVPKKSFFKRIGVGEAPAKTYFLPPMEIVEEK
ncbi:MAG: SLBB domain-containing protein [Elusimicrobiota bacterium]|nr:SLBB domain-containing protein [Elusimicrobiota bacterium]